MKTYFWVFNLSFILSSFALELQSSCLFDSLCVYGVKFCGNWLAQQRFDYILPPGSPLTLHLTTDESDVDTGFEVYFINVWIHNTNCSFSKKCISSSSSIRYKILLPHWHGQFRQKFCLSKIRTVILWGLYHRWLFSWPNSSTGPGQEWYSWYWTVFL